MKIMKRGTLFQLCFKNSVNSNVICAGSFWLCIKDLSVEEYLQMCSDEGTIEKKLQNFIRYITNEKNGIQNRTCAACSIVRKYKSCTNPTNTFFYTGFMSKRYWMREIK